MLHAHTREGYSEKSDIIPAELVVEFTGVVIQDPTPRNDLFNVPGVALRIHRNYELEVWAPRGIAVFVHSDLIPGRQTLDI